MKKHASINAILFDIDGVLVDVRRSYLEAIRQTVQNYFQIVLRYSPVSSSLLSLKEVEIFKQLGGLNNDWDCTFALILYFISLDPTERSFAILKRRKNILSLRSDLPSIQKLIQRVHEAKNAKESWYERAKLLFQEIYLGEKLFQKAYGIKPQFVASRGLINKETLIIPKALLENLKKRGVKLGIVTGRNRFEAEFVLHRFRIENYFQTVITADNVFNEEKRIHKKTGRSVFLGKPHPFSLLKAASEIGLKHSFLYVGDLPDDAKAAHACRKRMKMLAASLLLTAADPKRMKQELKRAKTDFILARSQDLLSILA